MQSSSAHLRGISAQITTAAATTSVANAVGSATKTMTAMQAVMNPAAISSKMAAFSRENQRLDMAGELISDAMDGVLDTEETEDETGELVGQVLDEIGIDLATSMQAAPRSRKAVRGSAAEDTAEEDELLARLATLKS
ncbi:hypothetical protein Vretimale_10266 [Volvox reticuliferus]|nr:hypothetical protein Vretifemale_578 [Volvox reticuliferus]GIM05844.1 hypothetical protein Vretimale_10266 [Volvox reticuliferus]